MLRVSSRFHALTAAHRIKVAVAVLIEGKECLEVLESDAFNGQELRSAAEELLSLDLDARFPYVGTMLRQALEEV